MAQDKTVQIYVENQRLDLFQDEAIKVSSSIQSISDISKVFTDFTQTFTVPASVANNKIFDHYYNNDLDGAFIANNRAKARIEINGLPFRRGKLQLEGSELQDNQAKHYKVTFYGDVTTLKDLFGTDKLSDLDYSGITHEYTGANVQTALTSTSDLDVRYPLISSSRVWNYGNADPNDISDINYPIDYTELFPALKDRVIMDAIETTYGVNFQSLFIDGNRFRRSFTWWKNRKSTNFTNKQERLLFNVGGTTKPLADSVIHVEYQDPTIWVPSGSVVSGSPYHTIRCYLTPSFTDTYYIDLFRNGALINTITITNATAGVGVLTNLVPFQYDSFSLDYEYSVYVRSASSGTVDGSITHQFIGSYTNGITAPSIYNVVTTATLTQTVLSNEVDWNSSAPDISVADWFSGVLKEFNLTCYPLATDTYYQIEPLVDWYESGSEVDITPYTQTKSIKVDRIAPYKEISFEWLKSKAFLNVEFSEVFKREYGDLKSDFNYDGGKFAVKLPFENMLFSRFTGTNLQVSYSLEEAPDYKPLIPKPVKLFLYDTVTTDVNFYFDNGSTVNLTDYMPMGQDMVYNSGVYSQNFGADESTLTGSNVEGSLYDTYYEPYLLNMFNSKSRKVACKSVLPISKLTELTLDDAIILRDKKYRIDKMTTDLTSGEVDFVLVSDFQPVRTRYVLPDEVVVGGTTIVVPVKPVKPSKGGYIELDATLETSFTTPTPSVPATITANTDLSFVVPANATGDTRINTYPVKYYYPDGTLKSTSYIVIKQAAGDFRLLAEDGAFLLTEDLQYLRTE